MRGLDERVAEVLLVVHHLLDPLKVSFDVVLMQGCLKVGITRTLLN